MFPLLYLSLIFLVLHQVVRKILDRRHDAAKAKELGCKPLCELRDPWWDPLSLTTAREVIATTKDLKFPPYLLQRTIHIGEIEGRNVKTFQFYMLGQKVLFTCEPENIKAILATRFDDFALGTERRGAFGKLLGDGIFTADGKLWEHSRAMLRPSFVRERVNDLDLEDRHNKNLMMAIPVNQSTGWTSEVDLSPLFFRLTLDSATEFLFGESVLSQLYSLPNADQSGGRDDKRFAVAFDTAQNWLARRARMQKNYWLINGPGFTQSCRECHEFIDYYVQIALSKELREKDVEKGNVKNKEKYVFLEELAQQTRDPVELRNQLLHILLAGRDTTASLLGWLFWLLARNQSAWEKLRATILEEFGTYDQSNVYEDITFSKLKGCQYLQWCLNEALRLFPVVPANGRGAIRDTMLPLGGGPDGQSPIFIKKGQSVNYSVFVMHRMKDLWGTDADEFRPERWAGKRPGWEYLPFNGGPRICLGQQFALTSASFTTVRLLQRFDKIENLELSNEVLHNHTLTDCSGLGVKVRFHTASS